MTISSDEGADEESGINAMRGHFGDRNPSVAAVQAIAAFRDVDPTVMKDRLHDYVDPDALDKLLQAPPEESICVIFQVGKLEIEMTNDGFIELSERPD